MRKAQLPEVGNGGSALAIDAYKMGIAVRIFLRQFIKCPKKNDAVSKKMAFQ
jgi:hypothetical protein